MTVVAVYCTWRFAVKSAAGSKGSRYVILVAVDVAVRM